MWNCLVKKPEVHATMADSESSVNFAPVNLLVGKYAQWEETIASITVSLLLIVHGLTTIV